MNSRVACEKDYFDLADHENPVLNDKILQNARSSNDFMELQKYGFFVDRESNDKTINQYGKKLINICTNCSIFSLNGQSKHYKNGAYTCKSSSVVYCKCKFYQACIRNEGAAFFRVIVRCAQSNSSYNVFP